MDAQRPRISQQYFGRPTQSGSRLGDIVDQEDAPPNDIPGPFLNRLLQEGVSVLGVHILHLSSSLGLTKRIRDQG